MAGEEKTKEVFGDYVSIYDFKQSVDDGATVPLFYENRIPELQLTNDQLNDDIYRVIEDAELDEDQQRKLERVLGQQYHLITRDDRLEKVAVDIVRHFTGRGFRGKGMVVCIDKMTAVRMYDKVKAQWVPARGRTQEVAGQGHPGGTGRHPRHPELDADHRHGGGGVAGPERGWPTSRRRVWTSRPTGCGW